MVPKVLSNISNFYCPCDGVKNGARLLNISARSITNKTEQLEELVIADDPHVVVLTETWFHTFGSDDDVMPLGLEIFF